VTPTNIVIATFGITLAVALGAYFLLVVSPEHSEQKALRKRLKVKGPAAGPAAAKGGLVQQEKPLSNLPALNAVLERAGDTTGPIKRLIEQAGMNLTVGGLVLMCACSSALAFAALRLTTRLWLVSLAGGVLAAFLPIMFVKHKAKRRVVKFEEQFPEAIDLLSRALKAGHAFTTGLSMVAAEMADPVGTEFRLAYDRQNFGMPLPHALRLLADRVPLLDAKFFVTAVLTQREAGGNLSEVLDNLASVIRERFKVKRQVRVVTAHARLTGWVLACLPPAMAFALFIINPDHMKVLWTDPLGLQLIALAITLQVAGSLVIRKLVNIEY
jgi:tight adherence protein B